MSCWLLAHFSGIHRVGSLADQLCTSAELGCGEVAGTEAGYVAASADQGTRAIAGTAMLNTVEPEADNVVPIPQRAAS